MKSKVIALAAFLLSAFSSAQVLAHHSFAAEFDSESPILLHGTVIKLEWTNPHTYFYIEVEEDDGSIEEWALEMGSPNGLTRQGWTRNTLQIGTEVIVRGTRARDGSYKGNVQTVVIAETCQRLFGGTSQRDFDESAAANDDCEL